MGWLKLGFKKFWFPCIYFRIFSQKIFDKIINWSKWKVRLICKSLQHTWYKSNVRCIPTRHFVEWTTKTNIGLKVKTLSHNTLIKIWMFWVHWPWKTFRIICYHTRLVYVSLYSLQCLSKQVTIDELFQGQIILHVSLDRQNWFGNEVEY